MRLRRRMVTFCLCSVLIGGSCSGFSANAEPSDNDSDYEFSASVFYDDVMQNSEWQNTESRKKRGEMLQLPDEILEDISTDKLIEAVLDYPFFCDVYAFDNVQTGVDILFDTFNGARELLNRSDAAAVLLDKYESEPVYTDADAETDILKLTYIEILLTQSSITDKMDETEISKFKEVSLDKYVQKVESNIYGEFTEC